MSCEARIRGRGEVLRAKSLFFLAQAASTNDPSLPTALLAGFGTMKRNLSYFLFSDPIIVGFREIQQNAQIVAGQKSTG